MYFTELSGKEKVRCDACGIEIECGGWYPYLPITYDGKTARMYDTPQHYCDECGKHLVNKGEFRICDVCGKPMTFGFTNEGNNLGADFHACEDCFEQRMSDEFGQWRKSGSDYEGECGGYYEAYDAREQEWYDTGVYWTQWD